MTCSSLLVSVIFRIILREASGKRKNEDIDTFNTSTVVRIAQGVVVGHRLEVEPCVVFRWWIQLFPTTLLSIPYIYTDV